MGSNPAERTIPPGSAHRRPLLLSQKAGSATIAEQTAIATILSDMDTELAELETRLAKTGELKQGMMQGRR